MPFVILPLIPPWVVLSGLLGLLYGGLFHLLFGRRIHQLPVALLIGGLASLLGGLLGSIIPPAVLEIGDTNLIAATLVAWLALGIARLFRFC